MDRPDGDRHACAAAALDQRRRPDTAPRDRQRLRFLPDDAGGAGLRPAPSSTAAWPTKRPRAGLPSSRRGLGTGRASTPPPSFSINGLVMPGTHTWDTLETQLSEFLRRSA
jgi:hypothetical protein